nr:hypothetical protein [bacterium]
MTDQPGNFAPFAVKMRREDLPEIVIRTFQASYDQLAAGETGMIPEADIEPVASLPDMADF